MDLPGGEAHQVHAGAERVGRAGHRLHGQALAVVLGLGAVLVQTAGPAYVAELAHPRFRGVLTGAYQTCFFLGTIVSTWLEYGLNFVEGTPQWTWRLPLAVQALPSVLVLAFVWFIPETPRW